MSYDVVIVGGGTTGCVLAARLSEDPSRSVLLLEAGPDHDGGPEALPELLRTEELTAPAPEYSWVYEGIADAETERAIPVFRGRVMGGSGAINGALFQRGAPEDYDAWGSPRWDFQTVLPYFRKLERDLDFGGDLHGDSGPVPVRRFDRKLWPASQEALYRAACANGFPEKADIMDPEGFGAGAMPRNSIDDIRMSAALTHLWPARQRRNLTVKGDTAVRRINFAGNRATGVQILDGSVPAIVEADEVIVAAGTIGSPHLLSVSGVGPLEVLDRNGIEVVHELDGVGRNLQDHPFVDVELDAADLPAEDPRHQVALVFSSAGTGLRNDMQLLVGSMRIPEENGSSSSQLLFSAILELPDSRGEVEVRSPDISVLPRIRFDYLRSSRDRERLREALRLGATLVDHEAFREIGVTRVAPTDDQLADDATLDRFVRENLFTVFHGCGTCRMGDESDPDAVVDDRCFVHGLERLRVADLSVAPLVPRAATNATAFMIGERVADL